MADISGLIQEADKATLHSASYVKGIADDAEKYSQEAAVAQLINTNANTGAYSVIVDYPLLKEVVDDLVSQGYAVTPCGKINETDKYRIDWMG